MDQEKQKAITALIGSTVKKYGEVIVDRSKIVPCDVIRSGSLAVDIATGIGGIPRGRISEVSGEESSGKTTLTLHAIANAQKTGVAAYVDAEHALDPGYARNLGVNMDELVIAQPDTAEQILGVVMDLSESGLFNLIVIDSAAAMIPRAILEGEPGDQFMAIMGRLMSQQMPKLVKIAAKSNTGIFFVNQLRSNMGASGPYGPTTTTTGGRSLKFYCSMRFQTARTGSDKDGDLITGNKTKVKVSKNKLAPPFREAETMIRFGEGYDYNFELIDIGSQLKLIDKAGSWYSYQGERIGQGKDNASAFLNANPDIKDTLDAKIREMYNIP